MFYFQIIAIAVEVLLVIAIGGVLIRAVTSPTPTVPSKTRRRVGDALIYFVVLVFFASGITKLAHVPLAVTEMGLLGLTDWKYLLVASVELMSGVLLLFRPTRSIALLFNSAHAGGAICAHLIAGQYFAMVPSAIVLSICWLGAFLRYPQMLWSLREASLGARGFARPEDISARSSLV